MFIYQIHSAENMLSFAPTLDGAKAIKRDWVLAGYDRSQISIERFSVQPTRAGIAEALNSIIDFTCFNEG